MLYMLFKFASIELENYEELEAEEFANGLTSLLLAI